MSYREMIESMSDKMKDKCNGVINNNEQNNDSVRVMLKRRSSLAPIKPIQSGRNRKLILHLDIRNTILVADSVTNVCVEHALNSFLTGVTWGKDVNGEWKWESDKVALKPPSTDTKTYYKHLEEKLVRTPADRQELRLQTGDFTQQPIGSDFLPYFEKHMELLKWDFYFDSYRDKQLTMAGKDNKQYHYVIPSVYKMIHFLKAQNREFAIVFRTYGLDAPNVLSSLAYGLKGNHPGFPKPAKVPINLLTGRIARTEDGTVNLETVKQNGDVIQKLTYERDIYRFLSNAEGISAFKDDFLHWQNNSYNYKAGKPMWIDPTDQTVHHIFFDDNFRSYEDDSIIDFRLFEDGVLKRARGLNQSEISRFEDMCLVQADLLESIENEDYFINKLATCEDNYSTYLKDRFI
ncbi:hypothetical protein SNE40_014474 [Patella caerulea]|uniref:Uncharacterized protein n=2 Tax=Patella caerulea TaxID=87958 RepID=A0AAN8JK60_PATCE